MLILVSFALKAVGIAASGAGSASVPEPEYQQVDESSNRRRSTETSRELSQLRGQNKQLREQVERLRAEMPKLNDEELKQRCLRLSEKLCQFFLGERAKEDPQTGVFSAETRAYHQETMAQYGQRFAGPVGALFGDLELRGWCDAKERKQFENPIMVLTVQQAANRLASIGHRL